MISSEVKKQRNLVNEIVQHLSKIRNEEKTQSVQNQRLTDQINQRMVSLSTAQQDICTLFKNQCFMDLSAIQNQLMEEIEKLRVDRDRHLIDASHDLSSMATRIGLAATPWDNHEWDNYSVPDKAWPLIRIGALSVDTSQGRILTPAMLPFAELRNILFKSEGKSNAVATKAVSATVLRMILGVPPGLFRLVMIDPVGRGDNLSAFMQLGGVNKELITQRIWTETQDIERLLIQTTRHMDDMIQKYLLNQHKSMQEYNLLAGVLAKPYWLLVINDFPAGFSEEAADRLVSIATKGPRCGIHTIISVDKDRRPPHDFDLKNLERASHVAVEHNGRFHLTDERYCNYQFELDQPPDNTRTAALLKVAGTAAKETETIEVPLSEMIVDDQQSPTTAIDGVRVPIGRVGADEIQELYLTGTNFHCLIIGQSGSGKSNLLHTVILSLASRYSPSELDIYLIDFKQGVEFKCYAPSQDQPGLPHASVVAIDSEREFGLSCLRRLKTIMQERGDLFRQADCNGYVEYRQKTGIVLPRIILIVDELHDFFSEDDAICQQAEVLFDHIARECRGFGMNLILCTQSLMGNSTPLKTTLSQFGTRIALRCGEDDSITIFDRDNPAAKYLSRPGEAIYNDANGLKEGNSPIFQVAFSEDEKEHTLRRIVDKLDPSQLLVRFPLVFEGRRPARLRGNSTFESHLQSRPSRQLPGVMQAWVGKPVAIKDPTTVCLTRAESSNLIVVGKNEETACGILLAASIGLAAQCSPSSPGQFEVFNLCMRNSEWVNRPQDFADILPHDIRVRKPRELAEALTELETIVAMRTEEDCTDAHPIFLITFGLHRLRELRSDYSDRDYNEGGLDSVTPSDSLSRILRDGPLVGVHTLSWCDTYSNLRRALETKDIDNFGIRIALQMSDMDSRELLDDYVACKLPDYRAVLLDDNYPGTLEKFIPYEMVTRDTIADIAALMSQKKRRAEET